MPVCLSACLPACRAGPATPCGPPPPCTVRPSLQVGLALAHVPDTERHTLHEGVWHAAPPPAGHRPRPPATRTLALRAQLPHALNPGMPPCLSHVCALCRPAPSARYHVLPRPRHRCVRPIIPPAAVFPQMPQIVHGVAAAAVAWRIESTNFKKSKVCAAHGLAPLSAGRVMSQAWGASRRCGRRAPATHTQLQAGRPWPHLPPTQAGARLSHSHSRSRAATGCAPARAAWRTSAPVPSSSGRAWGPAPNQ